MASLTLSETAVRKIKLLVADKGDTAGLRVKVVGGGCSGLQYRMEIDDAKERDKIFERDGAKLCRFQSAAEGSEPLAGRWTG